MMSVSVCLSVRLSVTEVQWRIIANLGPNLIPIYRALRSLCMRARGKVSSPDRVEGSSRAMLATARPSCWYGRSTVAKCFWVQSLDKVPEGSILDCRNSRASVPKNIARPVQPTFNRLPNCDRQAHKQRVTKGHNICCSNSIVSTCGFLAQLVVKRITKLYNKSTISCTINRKPVTNPQHLVINQSINWSKKILSGPSNTYHSRTTVNNQYMPSVDLAQ